MSGGEHDPKDMLRAGLAAPLFSADERGPYLRVATPFALPGGDLLVLFVLRHSDPPLLGDLGETLRWVRAHSFHEPPGAPGERAQQQISEACGGLGVDLHVGELRSLPAGPGFDGAQMLGVLHHVPGEQDRVDDMRRRPIGPVVEPFPGGCIEVAIAVHACRPWFSAVSGARASSNAARSALVA